jgi:hypothetical protein
VTSLAVASSILAPTMGKTITGSAAVIVIPAGPGLHGLLDGEGESSFDIGLPSQAGKCLGKSRRIKMPAAGTFVVAAVAVILAAAAAAFLARRPDAAHYRQFVTRGSTAGWGRIVALMFVCLAVSAMGGNRRGEFPAELTTGLVIIIVFLLFCGYVGGLTSDDLFGLLLFLVLVSVSLCTAL